MAVAISSPQFSFVNLNAPCPSCTGDNPPCLPVYDMSDLQFQVLASVTGSDKTSFGHEGTYPATIAQGPAELLLQPSMCFNTLWEKISTGTGAAPDTWVGYYVFPSGGPEALFNALEFGDCFNIGIYQVHHVIGTTVYYDLKNTSTTCFYKIADPCYTSLLYFGNNTTDAFGFTFTDIFDLPWYETIRLPLYLHSPVNAEEEKSYAKSDGSTQKLAHRVWKDYKFKMDYLDQSTIEKFTIATACDVVKVSNPYSGISGEDFVRTEKVEIEWKEEEFPAFTLGQAKGTLRLADVRSYVNTNCG